MKTNIHLNPKYKILDEFVLSIPGIFKESGEILYGDRNVIKKYNYKGFKINVKSFKVPPLINKFAYCYLRDSKAKRSYDHAIYLKTKGIGTPDPIAYIEISKGHLFEESYYISIHENTDGTIRNILGYGSEIRNDRLLTDFIQFTANLHNNNILHKDYSPGNILYREKAGKYQFLLVDLNRMRFGKCNIISRCRSFRRLKLNRQDIRNIAKTYSRLCGYHIASCFFLIYSYNILFWKIFLFKHPEVRQQMKRE